MQVELDRLGYEPTIRNTKGGETWEHPCGHSLIIYPTLKEYQRRNILRDCNKALGVKVGANKRNTSNIKERQATARETVRAENDARVAWLHARIHDLEMAALMRELSAKQQRLLNERLRELSELRQLMSQIPTN